MKLISPIVEPEGRSVLPKYAVEVSEYDDSLEDIPTRQTYTSTEKHIKTSTEVLADRLGIDLLSDDSERD